MIKRFTVELNPEKHTKLKTIAASKGISMRVIVERLIDGFIETMEKTND